MATINLTKENFEATVNKEGIVIVDFWANWCGACKTFAPVYEKVAAKYPQYTFGKVDTQAEKQIVSATGVEQIPALAVYRDGIMLFRQPGYYEEDKFDDIIQQAESLDMDEVRAHIAAEQEKQKES